LLTCTATHLPWRAVPGNAVRRKCRAKSTPALADGARENVLAMTDKNNYA
jgi:hypothetical protein